MKNKQTFYKEVIDLFFRLDTEKTSFGEVQSEKELSEILDLSNKTDDGVLNQADILKYIEKYIKYSLKTNHPQFLNRMWSGANTPGIAGEIVTALQQTSACTYESAPVSTLMEKYMIGEILQIVGFKNGEGQMTTGSSNANMISMMTARNLSTKDIKTSGLFESEKLYAFVNEESHYSFDKAVNILGIGSKQLIKVPVNNIGEIDISKLEKLLQEYSKAGKVFFVAATAGTTVRGAYDNIEELLKLKEKYKFWLHVDGAWGGPVFFSDTLRSKYLKGLEKVDSFTFDFHKMPGVALICNMLLFNNKKGALEYNCNSGNTDYIFKSENTGDSNEGDLGVLSLQCGRRVDSLKLFLDWRYYGQQGFAEKIEYYLSLCEYAENYVHENSLLEMTFERTSFNICFTYRVPNIEKSNKINSEIRTRLYKSSLSLVGSATIQGKFFLRLLICNEDIEKKDINTFFENVIKIGNSLTKNPE